MATARAMLAPLNGLPVQTWPRPHWARDRRRKLTRSRSNRPTTVSHRAPGISTLWCPLYYGDDSEFLKLRQSVLVAHLLTRRQLARVHVPLKAAHARDPPAIFYSLRQELREPVRLSPLSPPSVCVVQMSVRTSVLDLFHSVLLYRSPSHPSRPRFTTPLAPVYLARPHATTSRFPRDWMIV